MPYQYTGLHCHIVMSGHKMIRLPYIYILTNMWKGEAYLLAVAGQCVEDSRKAEIWTAVTFDKSGSEKVKHCTSTWGRGWLLRRTWRRRSSGRARGRGRPPWEGQRSGRQSQGRPHHPRGGSWSEKTFHWNGKQWVQKKCNFLWPDVAGFRMKAQNAPETLFVAPSVRKECDGADLNFGYHSYCSPSLSQNILISYLHSDLLYLF